MATITLMYGIWCPHCSQFRPTWEKVKKWCKKHNVKTQEYDDTQIQVMQYNPEKNTTGIPMDMVDGYPTIIIKYSAGNLTKIGDRSFDNIINLLKEEKQKKLSKKSSKIKIQNGGSYNKNIKLCNNDTCVISKQKTNNKKKLIIGGENSLIFYKNKYLTYKHKYLSLKDKLKL